MPPTAIDAGSLFREHAAFVAGFLTRLGAARADLDDLVQEVFLVAHRRGGFVPGTARPTTWLAEISVRVVSTRRRTLRRRPEAHDEAALQGAPSFVPDPARAAETAQALARVQRALEGIELDRRAVFVLFELEGESCDAIAAGLGLPLSTVYSRLHTARREFTAAYERLTAAGAPRPTPTALAQRVRP
jgi:RNA polymerase sigma-70 factor (ECF subfamily)